MDEFPPYFYDPIGENPIYGDFDLIYGDSIEDRSTDDYEFVKSAKIVELTDIGCDACPAPGFSDKYKSVIGKFKKNPEKLVATDKIQAQRNNSSRFDRVNENLLRKYSPSHVESNKGFYATEDSKDFYNFFEIPKNRENIKDSCKIRESRANNVESRLNEIWDRKKFTDRAVDSDCISNISKFSLENNNSDGSIIIPKHEINNLRMENETEVNKLREADNNEKFVCKSRDKTKLLSAEFDVESIISVKHNIQSKTSLEERRNFDSISGENLKAAKDGKNIEKSSGIPRFVERSFIIDTEKSNNSRVDKNNRFKGSKLPVWHGTCRNKSKPADNEINDKFIKIYNKKMCDNINKTNDNKHTMFVEKKCKKGFEKGSIIYENVEITKNNDGTISSKIDDNTETPKNHALSIKIDDAATKEREKINSSPESRIEKKNNKTAEDQSRSDLWSENYERAYANGRAVGLKIYRMAKAARDERKRQFRKYGFENYNQKPRKKPQEILDIGVSLVEKVLIDER